MREFRQSFWVTYAYVMAGVLAIAVLVLVPLGLWMLGYGVTPPSSVLVITFPLGSLLAALLVWLLVSHLTYGVGPEGLRGYDSMGRRRDVLWSDVSRAGIRNLVGLRYLVVWTRSGSPLWIPAFMTDRGAFQGAVQEFAPESSPVRQVLLRSA